MKDRFKFKAWDEVLKYMMYSDMYSDECGTKIDEVGTFLESLYRGGYKIMQCTGLKDRQGKLIYEGDVIKASWSQDENRIHQVVYGDWPTENGGWVLQGTSSHRMTVTENMIFITKLEVIGNIHENPELLTNNNPQEGEQQERK